MKKKKDKIKDNNNKDLFSLDSVMIVMNLMD